MAAQLIREYIYLYGAVSPKDGTCVYLDHADLEHSMLPGLSPHAGAQVCPTRHLAGARLARPIIAAATLPFLTTSTLLYLPPYSPELNPKENLWDELREKIFKNYALKSMDAVRAKLRQAILLISSAIPSSSAPSPPSPISSTSTLM